MRAMLDERLGVPVALEDHGLGLVAVEVDVVLPRSRVLGPHDLHALSGQALELLNLALVKLESSDTLKLTHSSDLPCCGCQLFAHWPWRHRRPRSALSVCRGRPPSPA